MCTPSNNTESEKGGEAAPAKSKWILRRLNSQQLVILLVLCCGQICYGARFSMLAPFFPEEAAAKGVSTSIQGIIFGSQPLAQVFFSPLFGKLMPTFGYRKLYIGGLLTGGAATVIFGFLTYIPTPLDGPWLFITVAMALQIVSAAGCSAYATAGLTLISQTFNEDKMVILTLFEALIGAGCVGGPVIGGLLYVCGGFPTPFITAGCMGFLCGIGATFCLKSQAESTTKCEVVKHSMVPYLTHPRAIVMGMSAMTQAIFTTCLGPILEPFLREFGYGPAEIGLLFAVRYVAYMCFSPMASTLLKRIADSKYILLVGYLFSGIGSLMIGPSPIFGEPYVGVWLVVASVFVMGSSSIFIIMATFDQLNDLLQCLNMENNHHTYGIIAGLFSSSYSMGSFLGPLLAGILYDHVGFPWTLTIKATYAVIVMFPLTCLLVYEKKLRPFPQKDAEIEPLIPQTDAEIEPLITNEESTIR